MEESAVRVRESPSSARTGRYRTSPAAPHRPRSALSPCCQAGLVCTLPTVYPIGYEKGSTGHKLYYATRKQGLAWVAACARIGIGSHWFTW